jgi:hypothetical protein
MESWRVECRSSLFDEEEGAACSSCTYFIDEQEACSSCKHKTERAMLVWSSCHQFPFICLQGWTYNIVAMICFHRREFRVEGERWWFEFRSCSLEDCTISQALTSKKRWMRKILRYWSETLSIVGVQSVVKEYSRNYFLLLILIIDG